MTNRQAYALANPRSDVNDLHSLPTFARTLTRGVWKFRTILTVDRFRKDWWWHASVSPLDGDQKLTSFNALPAAAKTAAERLARELIGDVGHDDSEATTHDDKSVQVVRRVTVEEKQSAKKPEELL